MATNVLMPQLGESIAEGTIVRWNKKVGDTVDRDEPLFEISTDKVDAEIPSPTAGVVSEIRVAEGETVPIDTVVALIADETGATSVPTTELPGQPTAPDTGMTVDSERIAELSGGVSDRVESGNAPTSPVVRRLATEHGVDVSEVPGTGARGRVTKEDVLKFVDARGERKVTADRVEPMTVMRRRIAEHMVASRRTSAHVHTVFDVDFSRVAAFRASQLVKYGPEGPKMTYLTFVAKAVIDAIQDVPIMNSSLDSESVIYRHDVNLGIAVALDWGLIVPVIKQADGKSLLELNRAIADLSHRARAKKLVPDDVADGTFTITNPGVFGSIFGMPIINQPQVAILCVGAIERRPAVVGQEVVPQTRAYLTLGFDHRVIDGAVADRFMAVVKQNLEQFDEAL